MPVFGDPDELAHPPVNRTLHVACMQNACGKLLRCAIWKRSKIDPAIMQEIDRLLDLHTEAKIAAMLNARGLRTGYNRSFTGHRAIIVR